ncbi:MAG: sulfur carrier protein ThiS adenylyltransferase ThiF [Victivallales bacterium]|nr:sulfur carrier protein ThiS adenylyltransferase ThiF [Victivallales bacterium]
MEQFNKKNSNIVLNNLHKFKIAIAGCGGLGSNIAQMLVRAGMKELTVIDFDKVCESNLNRQFYFIKDIGLYKVDALENNLRMINPAVEIEKHYKKINTRNYEALLGGYNIQIEAFDNIESKKIMLESFLNIENKEKKLICASGMAGTGDENKIKTRKLAENIIICGDGESDILTEKCIMAPRVILTAAHQANTVLRIITGEIETKQY